MRKSKVRPKRINISPAAFILLGFGLAILVGSLILTLPFCSAEGTFTPYIDALFTATTSVCVTGLVTVSTAYHWSIFGQVVILLLIQLGGMGVVAVLILFLLVLRKRIGMKSRILIQQSYSLDTMKGVVWFLIRIIRGMIIVELVGFICYLPVFCRQFGPAGIWKSLFLSVSAFCNAGMDILGDVSLAPYAGNYWINGVTMALIVLGGLGFMVWWEVLDLIKKWFRSRNNPDNPVVLRMSLHAKIVLSSTCVLILSGMLVTLLTDYHNPLTLGKMDFSRKCLAALFQSVTTRTAGFYTIPQTGLSDSASLASMVLMFIGGSPGGTAGGIKTMTAVILLAAILSETEGREEVVLFKRAISSEYVRKALTIVGFSFCIWLFFTFLLCGVEGKDFMQLSYETVSAIGTVGLSKDVTPMLSSAGKLIIICLMYAGRVGPVTFAAAFLTRDKKDMMVHYADENVFLG